MDNKEQTILELNGVLSKYENILTDNEIVALERAIFHLGKKSFGSKEISEVGFNLLKLVLRPEVQEQIGNVLDKF